MTALSCACYPLNYPTDGVQEHIDMCLVQKLVKPFRKGTAVTYTLACMYYIVKFPLANLNPKHRKRRTLEGLGCKGPATAEEGFDNKHLLADT